MSSYLPSLVLFTPFLSFHLVLIFFLSEDYSIPLSLPNLSNNFFIIAFIFSYIYLVEIYIYIYIYIYILLRYIYTYIYIYLQDFIIGFVHMVSVYLNSLTYLPFSSVWASKWVIFLLLEGYSNISFLYVY